MILLVRPRVKVIPDLRRCPPGVLRETFVWALEDMASYISLERFRNVDFAKKNMSCRFFFVIFYSAKKKIQKNRENDHASFNQINELIGFQRSADFCEIWSEYSLCWPNQIVSGISEFLQYFNRGYLQRKATSHVLCCSNMTD